MYITALYQRHHAVTYLVIKLMTTYLSLVLGNVRTEIIAVLPDAVNLPFELLPLLIAPFNTPHPLCTI